MNLKDKVLSIQASQKKPDILVIGDLMIDHYIWGTATRLSPEAPVPVVNVKTESTTLGGAGNVVQNLVAFGANVTVAGVTGDDAGSVELIEILENEGVKTDTIVKDSSRPTTVKTRVLAGSHQLVRIDREVTKALSAELEDELVAKLGNSIDAVDIVIFSDYNKGLFAPGLTQRLIDLANAHQKKVIVDPKGLNYEKYKGAWLIKPNRKELAEAAKAGRIAPIDPFHFMANLVGLTVFPFVGKPILQRVTKTNDRQFQAFMEERKKLVPIWIRAILQAKP